MKFGVRESVDVIFKAKSTFSLGARTFRPGEPVLIFDTVKTSTVEVASEIAYVTGGRGDTRLISFEGQKTLTFNFEEALLSAEGLAILAGADLIPSRNKNLQGASSNARSVIAHYNEKYAVVTNNVRDVYTGSATTPPADGADPDNRFPDDPTLYPASGATVGHRYPPKGGELNVWLTRKPYVGQNSDIYVMLLDSYGEMSGAPIQINLANTFSPSGSVWDAADLKHTFLAKAHTQELFIAFNENHQPMPFRTDPKLPSGTKLFPDPKNQYEAATFDDQVKYYVDIRNMVTNYDDILTNYVWASGSTTAAITTPVWISSWGPIDAYIRLIGAANYLNGFASVDGQKDSGYCYLLAPSGGTAQPIAFKEGSQYVYKLNVPSVLYQDIVLLDYYVEYRHDATQITILPDQFSGFFYVEGSTLVRRSSDGMDLPAEFVFPKMKISTALSLTLQATGDPSTFNFSGDAYLDYSKFDPKRKVLADIQILDADDNYDGAGGNDTQADPTSYRRFSYNEDDDGAYLWKDPSIESHQNIDYSDAYDFTLTPGANQNLVYQPSIGGPESKTPGLGVIDTDPS